METRRTFTQEIAVPEIAMFETVKILHTEKPFSMKRVWHGTMRASGGSGPFCGEVLLHC